MVPVSSSIRYERPAQGLSSVVVDVSSFFFFSCLSLSSTGLLCLKDQKRICEISQRYMTAINRIKPQGKKQVFTILSTETFSTEGWKNKIETRIFNTWPLAFNFSLSNASSSFKGPDPFSSSLGNRK